MRLLKIGQNAHMLETPAGALLFSYEKLTALRLGTAYYRLPGTLTTATRAHLSRFSGSNMVVVDDKDCKSFARYARMVLEAGERELLKGEKL